MPKKRQKGQQMKRFKGSVTLALLLLVIPAVVVLGAMVFKEKYYAWIALCIAAVSCVPLFYCFERKESSAKELTVIAVMIALSCAGRFIFAWLPAFKPVTALTVIAAVYLGKEAGFAIGSLSAVVSNFYFGQGPWTPFQMFAWGLIGFLAGLFAKQVQKSKAFKWVFFVVYGIFAGVFYSLAMDVWTTLWADGGFNLPRYIAAVATSMPTMVMYAISNIVFLPALSAPIGSILGRIKKKYGLFLQS